MSITVIVPLYNKVNEVCRALDSIFAQTIQDFELIIVDGGSTDGSLDIIKKYEKDARYHHVHQKSKGLPAGRNIKLHKDTLPDINWFGRVSL